MPTDTSLNAVLTEYTLAGRRRSPDAPDMIDMGTTLRAAGWPNDAPVTAWTTVDFARWQLLRERASTMAPAAFSVIARACFEQGDAAEQASWCRAVSLLPQPEQYLPIVIDACRTNIVPLFEAIACENPYPAAHFPERNFNQVVLKAMFNGIALARIVGLAGRRNAELARMATDYAAERTAAGRSVPADIDLAR